MERKRYDDAAYVDMEVEQEEVNTDETTSEREEEHSELDFDCSSMETSEIETNGEVYAWAVPTEQELERCASAWVSGGVLKLNR